MTEEEITSMMKRLAEGIKSISEDGTVAEEPEAAPVVEPQKAIREKSIICLESGKSFKILTKKHLAT